MVASAISDRARLDRLDAHPADEVGEGDLKRSWRRTPRTAAIASSACPPSGGIAHDRRQLRHGGQPGRVAEEGHRLGARSRRSAAYRLRPSTRARFSGGAALVAEHLEVPVDRPQLVTDPAEGEAQPGVRVGLVGEPAEHDGEETWRWIAARRETPRVSDSR